MPPLIKRPEKACVVSRRGWQSRRYEKGFSLIICMDEHTIRMIFEGLMTLVLMEFEK